MKIRHWSMKNRSGMHHVAAAMADAEVALGANSELLDPFDPTQLGWEDALDADIHVNHTHIPDTYAGQSFQYCLTKPYREVFVAHGTPELVFESAVRESEGNGYNAGMGYSHHQCAMQQADAIITFWPRHKALYDLATDKHTIVDCIPMGIDIPFWQGGVSPGKYQGTPSFFTCENAYPFKWGVEFLKLWPWVRQGLPLAHLHMANVPGNLERYVLALRSRYNVITSTTAGSWSYDHTNLRNIFKQVDYYLSPVRYGDANRACLEAAAAGLAVISYPGNPYADYWVPEGDQRVIAEQVIRIGAGQVAPLAKLPVPTERDMAAAALNVYERVLDRAPTNFAVGDFPGALDIATRDTVLTARGKPLASTAYPPIALVQENVA